MTWQLGLEDRGVVVTGAAGGIGRAVAVALAQAGARVAAVDLTAAASAEVVAGLEAPERHIAIGADLRDLARHDAILEEAREAFGRVDALVHLAAVLRRLSMDEVTEDDWDALLDGNLKTTFFLNRAAARALRAQGRGGRIVNFTSQSWLTGGFDGSVVYAASKGGVVSMSRSLARTLAPDGITVNTIAPGAVDTAMFRTVPEEGLEAFVRMIPMGRLAQPVELTGAVLLLVSDHASYITGATLNCSGGQIMY
jgi:NAD(P)-dependent dehydrogenase (short-subunit alcohol dehydrogenase family)